MAKRVKINTRRKNTLLDNIKEATHLLYKINMCRGLYKDLEEVTDEILRQKGSGQMDEEAKYTGVTIDNQKLFLSIVDNFKDKNSVWKSAVVKRFELKLMVENLEDSDGQLKNLF